MIRGIAYEQGKYGVRANCVCPGPVDTAWTHKETGPMDEQMEEQTLDLESSHDGMENKQYANRMQ